MKHSETESRLADHVQRLGISCDTKEDRPEQILMCNRNYGGSLGEEGAGEGVLSSGSPSLACCCARPEIQQLITKHISTHQHVTTTGQSCLMDKVLY